MEKVDELLLPERETTIYYIELVVMAVLTDSQNLESERVESRKLLHTFLENLLGESDFDLVYTVFNRKLAFFEKNEGEFYKKKQEIIDKILREKRVVDAEMLVQIYKADGFLQKEEIDVLQRLEGLKDGISVSKNIKER